MREEEALGCLSSARLHVPFINVIQTLYNTKRPTDHLVGIFCVVKGLKGHWRGKHRVESEGTANWDGPNKCQRKSDIFREQIVRSSTLALDLECRSRSPKPGLMSSWYLHGIQFNVEEKKKGSMLYLGSDVSCTCFSAFLDRSSNVR